MRQLEDYRYLAAPRNRQGAWWEHLKYIPLGRSLDAPFLAFGGEVRLRYELIDNTDFGSGPQDNGGYLLTRFMPYAALTLPNLPAGWELQLFAQFEAAFSNYDERGPGPIDQDDFDVIQAFAKISVPLGTGALSFQGGRQEISSEQSDCSARDTGPMCRSALMVAWCAGKIRSGISMDFT
jgi:Alginate export